MVNVFSPTAYQGLLEIGYRARNINFTDFTVATLASGASGTAIMTISTGGPFLFTGIQVPVHGTDIFIKPFDATGKEIFTDFVSFTDSLSNSASDPFPIIPMRVFEPLSRIRVDYQNNGVGAVNFEIILRGIEVLTSK